jgi:hypothetical protein
VARPFSTAPFTHGDPGGPSMFNNQWGQQANEVDLVGGTFKATAPSDCAKGEVGITVNVNGAFVAHGAARWTSAGQQLTGAIPPGVVFEPGAPTVDTLTTTTTTDDGCFASGSTRLVFNNIQLFVTALR